jgi:hypothetical protein
MHPPPSTFSTAEDPNWRGGIMMARPGFCGSRVRADWPQIEKHCHGHEKEQERLFYAALAK